MSVHSAPVITIDGPSGAGKGSAALLVAEQLGFHLLDSGSLYRLLALAAERSGTDPADEGAVCALAESLNVDFDICDHKVYAKLDGEVVESALRNEHIGRIASVVASYTGVRSALLSLQRRFQKSPGLVADGRDMGTVVFPHASLKVFLDASLQERADRRYKQLIDKGESTTIEQVTEDLRARDERDRNRDVAPLQAAEDAIVIDSTHLDLMAVVSRVLKEYDARSGPTAG